jgi:single-strand DNA-binding protein
MLEKADEQESDMAEGLNRVMLVGNLGADPELRVTPSGQSILKLRLATTESYLDKGGTRQERTEWHRITVWGKRGEALSKMLAKGMTIFVEGRIQTSSYEKNGEKRYSTDIVANNIFLSGRGRGSGAEQSYEGGGSRERAHGGGGGAGSGGGRAPAPAGGDEPGDAFSGDAAFEADDDIPF